MTATFDHEAKCDEGRDHFCKIGGAFMAEKSIEIGSYVIAYRILAKADGQPDLTESFSVLNRVLGDQNWSLMQESPGFNALKVAGKPIYTMDIIVSDSGLNTLKLHDVIHNEVRVIEERRATCDDLELLRGSLSACTEKPH